MSHAEPGIQDLHTQIIAVLAITGAHVHFVECLEIRHTDVVLHLDSLVGLLAGW
jgi:hypothetical protein